ncbi:IS200/IS605 family accessory protein TnpB-related protein [Arthrospira platensis]|jgi:IS605 OrfB family transposase|uniref:Transposase n=1 Tax=Limnospira platensis NIES-46 TaxID=1236695 RepID=A0A5M3TDD7_LIMPL|nr:IS200/IS605 family accessory protein TnpB-related protein [Arthrospira platensis]AMW30519.1 transposase [Arthrospira platensis YZ]KDR57434.1 transposase [Arthrospira platensis str. Paraca]MBD2669061.1 IS200/IS605 family element transposase accessory protein TnpB [Arthrospira platensis FACHB-439]MBD2709477.1 IS200/IS605 family element transposase accessory protein TnpB [Arthrospira platensis FACHB-835]MDF2207529.1 transposase [Arthrospira platensis NCB002]MDT9182032.1 transposase [Limnospir
MRTKKPTQIIRTDKWTLNPTAEQRVLFGETVKVYRRFCRYLVGIVFTHWSELGSLPGNNVISAVERLIHRTGKNPHPKYGLIDITFHKFPSYYRRAAIMLAVGQVSSYMTRYREWQSGMSRKRKDAKPPQLQAKTGCYPTLYKGGCYKLHGYEQIEIKVFTGSDWVWTTVQITGLCNRHEIPDNKLLSPSLIFDAQTCYLSVPFHCMPAKRIADQNVVAVDLGINTTATVTVVTFDGTVIHREFIHHGRDIDRRDKRLKSVSKRASKTMGKGGKLHKGFCSNTYRKCQNINNQISHIVSKRIVQIATKFNAAAIVFENLKGWRAKGGRRRSNLRQRFHGWLKAKIRDYTEMKWQELGGEVIDVVAAYTSKLAYDGSGIVKRDAKNYALATLASGKRYNCDLNASQNIAARGILQLTRRKDSEDLSSQRSGRSPRSWACLCDLWTLDSSRLA